MVLILFLMGVALPAAADQEYSHARIVRLSFVQGTVAVLAPGSDWANAPINTPVQEGFQLSTDKGSFAEVQFENGSTARLGELSLVKFDQLGLTEAGDSLNVLTLNHGYGTFRVIPDKVESFEVHSGDAAFKAQGKAEFRVDLDQDRVRLEVFKGTLDVSSPGVSTTLARNDVLELTPGSEEAYSISRDITRDDWDQWVAERDEQEAENRPPAGSLQGSPAYGWSDLNNYGTWSYLEVCGYGWIPDVGAGWTPFSLGQWSWYPGFGYTWISYQPWGWLPFHYGGWSLDPLFGWAWCPGNAWGPWIPANVVWYEGPGWFGWMPKPPTSPGRPIANPTRPAGCQGAPGCITAVNLRNFTSGRPVLPRDLVNVDPSQARQVAAPVIEPGRLASLPGTPVKLSSALRAILNGDALRSEHTGKASPGGGAWAHSAPSSAFVGPPQGIRGGDKGSWAGQPIHAGSASAPGWSRGGSPGSFEHSSPSSGAAISSGGGSASHATASGPHK